VKPPLFLLVGPTASGKSGLALDWACRTGGWILSCDALLFYRGADIGTAKPSTGERREIPHYGIDLCPPDSPYDLSRYVEYSLDVLERAASQNIPVLVVGGSGFYAAAFHDPPPDSLEIAPAVRARVAAVESSEGVAGLRDALLAVDPDPDIDLCNPRRLVPALERCLTTGLTTRRLRERQKAVPCPFETWERHWFCVDRPEEETRIRITTRTQQMLREGLIDEVRDLDSQGIRRNPTLAQAIGYRETLACIDGRASFSSLADEISLHTEQLAKRQKRWIRKRLPQTKPVSRAEEIG